MAESGNNLLCKALMKARTHLRRDAGRATSDGETPEMCYVCWRGFTLHGRKPSKAAPTSAGICCWSLAAGYSHEAPKNSPAVPLGSVMRGPQRYTAATSQLSLAWELCTAQPNDFYTLPDSRVHPYGFRRLRDDCYA